MAITASLTGRLRNTSLSKSRALSPLFEAVVNAIQAVDASHPDDMDDAQIEVRIIRGKQGSFQFEKDQNLASMEPISGFIVTDNGEGFHDDNMKSFRTLDSEYKSKDGCRGVGRLLWLKAFDKVQVISCYESGAGMKKREFTFTQLAGVSEEVLEDSEATESGTEVRLISFQPPYPKYALKGTRPIAKAILEHCLWYFVRPGGAPHIKVVEDDSDDVDLNLLYDDYMVSSADVQELVIKNQPFELIHMRLRTSSLPNPQLNWCAANRVVDHYNLTGRVPGLHGKLTDGDAEFMYACYLMSPFLNRFVRPERTGFDIADDNEGALDEDDPSKSDILAATLRAIEQHLHSNLAVVRDAGEARLREFVDTRAPRYRPILPHINERNLSVDPTTSDKELELQLHKILAEFDAELLEEGQRVLASETMDGQEYKERVTKYLEKVEAIKQSDLAAYVTRRRVILDLLEKAILSDEQGKYSKEEVVHNLIIPMGTTSDSIPGDASNLWVIDERLAFHNYLASDKTIKSMPITGSDSTSEPDLTALKLAEKPILVAEGEMPPHASIVVVEFKRPMRDDAAPGSDRDPIDQALNYLEKIRDGKVTTARGRPILGAKDIPGFCYVVADLTPTMIRCCKRASLNITNDCQGYFGFNPNYNAYIEVISFDRLLIMAKQRNRAFFDRLGLPAI
jgi:hypothetical protein